MNRPEVFCNFQELEKLFFLFHKERVKEDYNYQYFNIINDRINMLLNNSTLILDLSQDALESLFHTNPIIKNLIKKSVTGGSEIIIWENFKSDLIDNDRYLDYSNAFFYLNISNDECEKFEKKFGMLFLNYELLLENDFLLIRGEFSVSKKSKVKSVSSWEDFKILSHPFNSIVIIDNYLIDKTQSINDSLIPFLQTLLPMQLTDCSLDFLILTLENDNSARLKSIYNIIQNEIIKLKKPYKINFSIVTTSKVHNHDRSIITNYLKIFSGNSFNYFKNNKTDTETNGNYSTIFNISTSHSDDAIRLTPFHSYLNIITILKDIINNHNRSIIGNGKCRLLS